MLLPNINTILNMDIQDINYPGFNRSLDELNAITKLKKKSCEILDFTEIEWVRDVLRQRINENNDLEIKFKTPTEKQIAEVSAVVGADIDMEDLKIKMTKDVGVWITYVKESDTIKNIDFPRGWSAGSTAIHLACQQGAEEIYMLGFDLSSYDKPINNIYKGTNYYYPEHTRGFNPVNWMNQLKTVFGEFPDTQFYWVDWAYDTPPCYNHNNVGYLTKTELCDKLNIR